MTQCGDGLKIERQFLHEVVENKKNKKKEL
jgi:hypothetical protein